MADKIITLDNLQTFKENIENKYQEKLPITQSGAQVQADLNLTENLQDAFSTSSTYAINDIVIYDSKLYKCTSAVSTAGAWDSSKWTQIHLSDLGSSGGGGGTSISGYNVRFATNTPVANVYILYMDNELKIHSQTIQYNAFTNTILTNVYKIMGIHTYKGNFEPVNYWYTDVAEALLDMTIIRTINGKSSGYVSNISGGTAYDDTLNLHEVYVEKNVTINFEFIGDGVGN